GEGARTAGRAVGRRADRRRPGLGQAHRHRGRRAVAPRRRRGRRRHGPRVRAAVLAGLGPRPDRLPAARRPAGGPPGVTGRGRGRIGAMPIATPEAYAEMLDTAKARSFAYPAINVTSSQTLNAVIKGFAEAESDGIVQ